MKTLLVVVALLAATVSGCGDDEDVDWCTTSVDPALLDVDHNGVIDTATDVTYIARVLNGLPAVPQSFRDLDPSIISDDDIVTNMVPLLVPSDCLCVSSPVYVEVCCDDEDTWE